ncbi:MAG: uracil-DNA glycosylase family protein [Planctomycetota bacterium]
MSEGRRDHGTGERGAAAASLDAHLAGLESWGIRFLSGSPPQPTPEAPAAGSENLESRPGPRAAASAERGAGDESREAPAPGPRSSDLAFLRRDPSPPGPEQRAANAGRLEEIAAEVASCTSCALCRSRTQTVFGVGDPVARLLFVGEAPGRDEDLQGEPFVGRAGQLLDRIIAALGLRREEVYIANVLKCRPPGNREPTAEEVIRCTPFLGRQIEAISPEVIVALGRPAANFLLDRNTSLARLRGGRHSYLGIPVVVTYHPAYLLRNPAMKKHTWHDLQGVIELLGLTPPAPARPGGASPRRA